MPADDQRERDGMEPARRTPSSAADIIAANTGVRLAKKPPSPARLHDTRPQQR